MEKKKHAEGKAEQTEQKETPAEVGGEEGAKESAEPAAPAKTEAEIALERALADAEDYKRKWYAVSAEYENYRKRTASVGAQRYNEGRADVVKGLFPIADNLDRALAACSDENTRKGIQMVKDAFEKLLEGEGIEEIYPLGEPFDAQKHEAIMAVDPAEGEESGIVKQVYLKGYEKGGKVLRFAQVIVIK